MPAAESILLAEVRPGERVRPSAAPDTTVSDLVSSVKPFAPSLDSMARMYSLPPWGFLPLAAAKYPSLAAALIAVAGSWSDAVTLESGITAYSKVDGVSLACSFSSQDPHGYIASLSWFCWSWTSVCFRPRNVLLMYLLPISPQACAACLIAGACHAPALRLSMSLSTCSVPIFAALVRTARTM